MNFSGAAPRLLMIVAAFLIGAMLFRTGVSQGLKTVIAAEPPPGKAEQVPQPLSPLGGCTLDMQSRYSNPLRCRMEVRAAQAPSPTATRMPVASMSKAQSERAAGWFLLAGLALPIAFAGAALLFLPVYLRAKREDEKADEAT